MPAESEYFPVGNIFKNSHRNTPCANCDGCITQDIETVRCGYDVYQDGAPFPRERVFEGDGVLMPRCFMYTRFERYFGQRELDEMRRIEGRYKHTAHPVSSLLGNPHARVGSETMRRVGGMVSEAGAPRAREG